jgi:hypothetical protein
MARLRLLPGEKELVRLRPTPGAWLGRYLLAALWACWGAALLWGPGLADFPHWRRAFLGAALPAVVVVALYLPRRRYMRMGLGLVSAASVVIVAFAERADALSGALGLAGLMALLLTETDRRISAYRLTNLRILHQGGLWSKEPWTVHYDAVLDVDARQSPVGRLLGYGNLEPVLSRAKGVAAPTRRRKLAVPAMSDVDLSATPRLRGVGPFKAVRHLVACFIQDATATEYMRAEQDTSRRVADAIRAIGSANILRR